MQTHLLFQRIILMKFQFNANIIRRRRASKSALFFGLIAAALLGYFGLTFFELGEVPFIEKFARQLGFAAYTTWVYLGIFATLFLLILPSLYTIFKKKVTVGGQVFFDEKHLKIVRGREKYLIPEEELTYLRFDLKPLPQSEKAVAKKAKPGGNYLKIPTTKGEFRCELDINTPQQKEQLMEMIEFLKIEHDVKVEVNELSR